jgi:hypothetical protein
MLIFFSVTLVVSIVALSVLVALKQWELESGQVLLAQRRPAFGRVARRVIFWVERVLPALTRYWVHRAWRATLAFLHRNIALSIVVIEHWLERVLHFMHRKTTNPPAAPGEASAFLQEVAAHKKKLLKSTAYKRLGNKRIESDEGSGTTPA